MQTDAAEVQRLADHRRALTPALDDRNSGAHAARYGTVVALLGMLG